MIVRKAEDRGGGDYSWLRTRHSFSFADYYDPQHMGFSVLRVINEDWVQPAQGFETHGHRDMEIITFVLEGVVAHRDSMGNSVSVRAGEFQRMSAGTGIQHSEKNPSSDEVLHLYQIWILPTARGLRSSYEQVSLKDAPENEWTCVVHGDGTSGRMTINQDVSLWLGRVSANHRLLRSATPARSTWLQVTRGSCRVHGVDLSSGDGVAWVESSDLSIETAESVEVLLFDLPPQTSR